MDGAQTLNSASLQSNIAIIGMSCRFPGANDIDQYWARILAGSSMVKRFDESELRAAGIPERLITNPGFIGATGLIEEAGAFDPEFFRITPSEAQLMDPQHRLMLELSWHALEDAGYNPYEPKASVGMFAGGGRHAYLRYVERNFEDIDYLDGSIVGLQSDIGNYGDFLATRVSYKLGLRGPSMNVQTACSTGLVAVHLACQSLLLNECEMALAAAVNLHTPQFIGYYYEEGSICSPDGQLRPFDAKANGSVFGNGGGVVVLKKLDSALRDRDRIIAVIKSTAINNDGADKMSFTAPSIKGQAEVIRRAHMIADVDPSTIGYVETHGTGTRLGDPIEITALKQAFGDGVALSKFCALGTVKSQIGHLGPAAGIAGLIKAALVVERGKIPSCVNHESPNPECGFTESPFFVPKEVSDWSGNRRAGVSAFGVGGTNAHAVLEQHEAPEKPTPRSNGPLPLILSAATTASLSRAARSLSDSLSKRPDLALGDVAHVLANGRNLYAHRIGISARSVQEAAEKLAAWANAEHVSARAISGERKNLPVVFCFPGMGVQYPGAGASLYKGDVVFRETVDACAYYMSHAHNIDIMPVIFPTDSKKDAAADLISRAEWAQPAMFIVEYAMARAISAAGVQPEILIGHSVGEYAAACLAGVFSMEDALRLVLKRGELMSRTDAGAMLAVGLPSEDVLQILPADLDIAAINTPEQTVVSGPIDAIARFDESLANTEFLHTILGTSVAAHSSTMDPILDEFAAELTTVRLHPHQIPIASTLLGAIIEDEMTSHDYWVRHLRETVKFMDAARAVAALGPAVAVEVGPGRSATGMFRQSEGNAGSIAVTPLLKDEPQPSASADVAAEIAASGGRIGWDQLLADHQPQRVALPGYSFDRGHHWTTPTINPPLPFFPPLGQVPSTWLWEPVWQPRPAAPSTSEQARAIVVVAPAQWVSVSEALAAVDNGIVVVSPNDITDMSTFQRFLAEQADKGRIVDTVVFVSNNSEHTTNQALEAKCDAVMSNGFWPALNVAKALESELAVDSAELLFVTFGRHLLPGDAGSHPESALMCGPARVIPQEYPKITTREIDFAYDCGIDELVSALATELADRSSPIAPVAYRDGFRHALEYLPMANASATPPWRRSGRYLITGGLGGIGLTFAEEAASFGDVSLTLVSRKGLPDVTVRDALLNSSSLEPEARRQLATIKRLEASGAEVICVKADVSDRDAMAAVVRNHGPFTGVVHAAGIASGNLIDQLDTNKVNAVIAPKVHGALLLDELLEEAPPEWTVFCSSLSAAVGGVGHADYCSANAFLDALAEQRTAAGKRTLSLAYDAWADIGMAAREAERSKKARSTEPRTPNASLQPCDHPLLNAKWRTQEAAEFQGQLVAGADWVIDEHKLNGLRLIPGTGILEYLHAAAAQWFGVGSLEVCEVDLIAPVAVGEGETVLLSITISGDEEEIALSFASRTSSSVTWAEHALATARPLKVAPKQSQFPHSRSDRSPAGEVQSHLSFGQRWSNINSIARHSEDTAVLEICLQDQFHNDLASHPMHPALLDTAAGGFLPLISDDAYLPMSYERVLFHEPLPALLRSKITHRSSSDPATISFDVEIFGSAEHPIMEIYGYTLRRIDPNFFLATSAPGAAAATSEGENDTLVQEFDGDLTSLSFASCDRVAPAADEVEIETLATGLNFKEVLLASGLLERDPMAAGGFGLECSGVVRRVGKDVTDLKSGDPVMAIGKGCFDRFVCVSRGLVQPIPAGVSYVEAATIPVAFTTAYDALVNAGDLKADERVLVHAASGGVGMAAIQVARHLGATVVGTASSDSKRQAALDLGAERMMNSRSTMFEQETIEGGGVDLVLNSLSGDFIAAGLRTLRPRGRFVELGRRDIVSGSRLDMSLFAEGKGFISYYPDPNSKEFQTSFEQVVQMLARGQITALQTSVFSPEEVSSAFVFLARAEHIGKVVVARPGADQIAGQAQPFNEGSSEITPTIGLRTLAGAFSLGRPNVLATTRNINRRDANTDFIAKHALESAGDQLQRRRIDFNYDYEEPVGEVEISLAAIWADILRLERVGREDRFLHLGGDSLYATQVAARIRREFDRRVAPSAILKDVPLKDLAKQLSTP